MVAQDKLRRRAGGSQIGYRRVERLKEVIAANARDALPELAGKILAAVRMFGQQFDDRAILLVRCL
jgi:hypothetical protein